MFEIELSKTRVAELAVRLVWQNVYILMGFMLCTERSCRPGVDSAGETVKNVFHRQASLKSESN